MGKVLRRTPLCALTIIREINPELARLVDAWPALPAPIQAGILAMIDVTKK